MSICHPDAHAHLYDNALKALAGIHLADPQELGLSVLADPKRGLGGLDQQIPHYDPPLGIPHYEPPFRRATGDEAHLIIEAAFEWIKANRPPAEEQLVIS